MVEWVPESVVVAVPESATAVESQLHSLVEVVVGAHPGDQDIPEPSSEAWFQILLGTQYLALQQPEGRIVGLEEVGNRNHVVDLVAVLPELQMVVLQLGPFALLLPQSVGQLQKDHELVVHLLPSLEVEIWRCSGKCSIDRPLILVYVHLERQVGQLVQRGHSCLASLHLHIAEQGQFALLLLD